MLVGQRLRLLLTLAVTKTKTQTETGAMNVTKNEAWNVLEAKTNVEADTVSACAV